MVEYMQSTNDLSDILSLCGLLCGRWYSLNNFKDGDYMENNFNTRMYVWDVSCWVGLDEEEVTVVTTRPRD